MKMKKILCYLLPVAAMLLPAACTTEEEDFGGSSALRGDGFVIEAVCQNMLPQQVATRSSIAKDEDEKRINQLYLFFFDSDGNYLETNEKSMFFPYMAPAGGTTNVSIPTNVFADIDKAAKTTIYALANMAEEVIADADGDGYPDNFPNEGKEGKTPQQLLDEFVYDPVNYGSYTRGNITDLPSTGMPMVGKTTNAVNLTAKGSLTMQLKALMARIDLNISIECDHSDASGQLPRLTIAEWGVYNMPNAVPLTEPARGVTALTTETPYRDVTGISSDAVVYNHGGAATFTFYMFENMIEPDVTDYTYPEGVKEEDKQRWKPQLVGDDSKATCFKMKAYYTTYNGDPSLPANADNATIEAEYTFYLGANAVNDFKVMRNRHYANNIVIGGLTRVGNDSEKITFDARVDVAEQTNPFFLNMLRERDHDAHFCITPLDVYLFEEDANPQLTVSINDPENHAWIRMEYVPAENMAAGTLPNGMTEETHIQTGSKWASGNGKRRYFTTDLVTNSLANNTAYILTANRDRIYFYLDENLSTKDRSATINISYTDDNTATPRTRTIQIVQHGLMPVTVQGEGSNATQTIYVEAYEEYLSHYDPLNVHGGGIYIYDGLEWGLSGTYLATRIFGTYPDTWCNVYYNGAEATLKIVETAGQTVMNLNEKPGSAAEYCYNKNKRDANGNVQGMSNTSGWFLPGIRQLEAILTTYYNTYPEFQQNFYWSSAAGKRQGVLDYYEDSGYARATKALSGGGYAPSDVNDTYTSETGTTGKAPRTGTYLRIRAAYIPPSGVTIE